MEPAYRCRRGHQHWRGGQGALKLVLSMPVTGRQTVIVLERERGGWVGDRTVVAMCCRRRTLVDMTGATVKMVVIVVMRMIVELGDQLRGGIFVGMYMEMIAAGMRVAEQRGARNPDVEREERRDDRPEWGQVCAETLHRSGNFLATGAATRAAASR
jgi:hypothetical protein